MSELSRRLLKDLVREVKPGFACGEVDANGIFQIRMNNVTKSGDIDLSKQRRVPRNHPGIGKNKLLPGDVLFNATNSPDLVGKTLFWSGIDEEVVYSNHFQRIRTDVEKLDPKYLSRWLACQFESGIFRSLCKQWVNQATVSKESLLALKVPLPPLPHQKRIVAVLDQLDVLRAKCREAIVLLGDLTQSTFIHMFRSEDYPIEQLSEVVREGTIVTYGIVQAGDEFEGGVPYIRTGDLKNGEIVLDGLRHTDPSIAAKFVRSRVDAGDIVMSIRATVGTTALVPAELDGANLTQGTARIAPGDKVTREYLLAYLRSHAAQAWIQRQVKGATFREITLGKLRELKVPLPPLTRQLEFSQRVQAVEAQLAVHRTHLAALDELFTSLQHRAFSGTLWDHEATGEAA
ncbi:restriction endonuclease subunit S [Streptomyces sp. NPDC054804]